MNFVLQLLHVLGSIPQALKLCQLDKQINLLIGELPYNALDRRFFTDELITGKMGQIKEAKLKEQAVKRKREVYKGARVMKNLPGSNAENASASRP